MRIGYDAKRLFNNFTGLGNYSRTLLKNLETEFPGNEYHLYTSKIKQSPETDFFTTNTHYKIHRSKAVFASLWRSISIRSQLEKDGIALYHGLSHELPFNISRSPVKSVVTIHDLIFKIYPDTYPPLDRAIYDLKFKYSCQNADRIIAISESTKQDIIRYYDIPPHKIEVVYQSCAPLYFEKSTSKQEAQKVLRDFNIPIGYFLYTGSVTARKNLLVLINAYRQLPKALRAPLVIVGRGKKYLQTVKKAISAHHLDNQIIWLAHINDNRHLKILYENATALIYPSVYEGFGLPVVEALLCKTPVITTNVSSLPEAGGPNTLYFDPANSEELAHLLTKVSEDTSLRTEMMEKGYAYAREHFNGTVTAHKTMRVYEKVMSNEW